MAKPQSSGRQSGGERIEATVGRIVHPGKTGPRFGQHQTTDGAERLLPVRASATRSSRRPRPSRSNILFRIVPGPRARVGHITVTGAGRIFRGTNSGHRQDAQRGLRFRARVSRALDRLRKKYQKQDRLLSQVAISSRTYRPQTNTVDYAFEIEPGPKVEIAVEGFKISHSTAQEERPGLRRKCARR